MNPTESLREQERLRDAIALALVKLAEHNVPPDTQEMLLAGNHETKPGALNSVVKALLPTHQPAEVGGEDSGVSEDSYEKLITDMDQRISSLERQLTLCASILESTAKELPPDQVGNAIPAVIAKSKELAEWKPPAAKTGGE